MSNLNNNNTSAINPNTAKNRKKKAKKKAKKQNAIDLSNNSSEATTPALMGEEDNESHLLPATGNRDTAIITEAQTTPANTSTLSGEASVLASSLPVAKPAENATATNAATSVNNNQPAIMTEAQTTPANTSTLSGEASVLASSLPAKPVEDTSGAATTQSNTKSTNNNNPPAVMTEAQTTPANTTTLSGEGSVLASSLPTKPIDENGQPSTTNINRNSESAHDSSIPAAGPVGAGAQGATAAAAATIAATGTTGGPTAATGSAHNGNTGGPSGGSRLPHESHSLPGNVRHAIETAVASKSIDLHSIVDKIRHNISLGDYKEKAKLPSSHASATTTSNSNETKGANSNVNPIKKVTAGIGAAIAGVGAAKAKPRENHATTSNNMSIDNKPAAPPPPPSPKTAGTTSELAKLSDSVQHCIKSAVQARFIDVYGIIDPSKKVKRPEAAVGSSSQPTMPSSAKAPDVPKKTAATATPATATTTKSSEHRNKPSFLNKKKNCIVM